MPNVETSTPELFRLAASRGYREDLGATALWHYPGSGPRILMVHGFRGSHMGLIGVAAALDDFEVLIPDLPGYGKTPHFEAEHSLDNYAKWLINMVSQLGPITLLGHSFGTLVIARAISMGLRAERIVLQNPIARSSDEIGGVGNWVANDLYRMAQRVPKLGHSLLRTPAVVRTMSVAMTTSLNPALRGFIHDQHSRYFSDYQLDRVAIEGFNAASSGSVLAHAKDFQDPTLIIAGERDLIAPLDYQVELQRAISKSRLAVIPRVGHLTHYETPIQVAQLIREFISG